MLLIFEAVMPWLELSVCVWDWLSDMICSWLGHKEQKL